MLPRKTAALATAIAAAPSVTIVSGCMKMAPDEAETAEGIDAGCALPASSDPNDSSASWKALAVSRKRSEPPKSTVCPNELMVE